MVRICVCSLFSAFSELLVFWCPLAFRQLGTYSGGLWMQKNVVNANQRFHGFFVAILFFFLGDNHIFWKAGILVFGERFTLFYGLVFLSGCGLFSSSISAKLLIIFKSFCVCVLFGIFMAHLNCRNRMWPNPLKWVTLILFVHCRYFTTVESTKLSLKWCR